MQVTLQRGGEGENCEILCPDYPGDPQNWPLAEIPTNPHLDAQQIAPMHLDLRSRSQYDSFAVISLNQQ
jgi:hypothetical protein